MNKESVSQGHKLTESQTQLLHPAQPGFSKERPLVPPTTADQSLLSAAQITMHSTHQAVSGHCLSKQPTPPVAPGNNDDATTWGTHARQLPNKPLLVCNSTSRALASSVSDKESSASAPSAAIAGGSR